MSKMNELSLEEQYAAYEQYIEEQRQELRREGAEELRAEILREIEAQLPKMWDPNGKHGLNTAKVIVTRAQI